MYWMEDKCLTISNWKLIQMNWTERTVKEGICIWLVLSMWWTTHKCILNSMTGNGNENLMSSLWMKRTSNLESKMKCLANTESIFKRRKNRKKLNEWKKNLTQSWLYIY